MSHVNFRERVVHAGTASVVGGVIVIRDPRGVIRWSNSPADRSDADRQVFNLNNGRLHYLEKLIATRYGGPCDCDGDVQAYLSVGLNALALSCRMKGWKPHIGPLLKWAGKWLPAADPIEVRELAEKIVTKPRRMKAATAGKLLRLARREWETLGIKYIDPFDVPAADLEKEKKKKRSEINAMKKAKGRRDRGAPTAEQISANSLRRFCEKHEISERTLRAARARGPAALAKFLAKRGITANLPHDGATIVREPILILRHEAATFSEVAGPTRPKRDKARPSRIVDAKAKVGVVVPCETFEEALRRATLDGKPRSALSQLLRNAADQLRVAT